MQKRLTRGAGLLLPVSSLPSPYGIGTLGKAAYEFIDFLISAGQKYWQVLPVGPTSYGDSPYQSFSAFAGNPYFIDLDTLAEEGLVEKAYLHTFNWGDNESYVDYGLMYESRFTALKRAYKNSSFKETKEYKVFLKENEFWLNDYCLYMACKNHFGGCEWLLWDEDIRFRKPEAVAKYQTMLAEEIDFWAFCQFKFYEQWDKLKAYAAEKEIEIIGDIPIYVAYDSADVWTHPEQFQLEENLTPKKVAGVPPDAFSETGQLWGNPLYNWEHMEKEDFAWWRKRIQASEKLYDVIRIDHFIGVSRYYAIPGELKDATKGEFFPGPGQKLTDAINDTVEKMAIIAEDLGVVTQEVKDLLKVNGYPGMKVLSFAFDSGADNEYLPHNYQNNYVVYGGTHDNETLAGCFLSKTDDELEFMFDYLDIHNRDELIDKLFLAAYASVADVAVFQVQDVLKLDNSARMNFPSTIGDNWKWRLKQNQIGKKEAKWLKHLTEIYGR